MRPAPWAHATQRPTGWQGMGSVPSTLPWPPRLCHRVRGCLCLRHGAYHSPSLSLAGKQVHTAGLSRERPQVQVRTKENSTCWGPPRSSVKPLHSHSAHSLILTPPHTSHSKGPPSLPTQAALPMHPFSQLRSCLLTHPSRSPSCGPHTLPVLLLLQLLSPPPFSSLPWEGSCSTGQGELARGLSRTP